MCLYQDICLRILKLQMCKLSDKSKCNEYVYANNGLYDHLYVEKDVHNDSIVPLTSAEHYPILC